MSAFGLALVLLAALLHAVWNLVVKKAGGGRHFALICALLLVVIWAPLGAWAGWDEIAHWGWTQWGVLLVSALLHIVYFLSLLRGYREADLSVVYPVARGSAPLLTSIGAMLWLAERPGPWAIAGIVGVTAGVFLVAGGPSLWQRTHGRGARERLFTGLRYGALSGTLIAAYTLVDGYAVKVMAISPILVDYIGNALRIPVLAPAALADRTQFRKEWRAHWRAALVVALCGPAAYVLVLYAMRLAPLSHVAPAREVSTLFAALLGGHMLGESDRALRIAGAVCIAAGVIALALG